MEERGKKGRVGGKMRKIRAPGRGSTQLVVVFACNGPRDWTKRLEWQLERKK